MGMSIPKQTGNQPTSRTGSRPADLLFNKTPSCFSADFYKKQFYLLFYASAGKSITTAFSN